MLNEDTTYKGVIGFLKGGMKASLAKQVKIDTAIHRETSAFERIVLATPIWAGETAPAINAVLSNVDFRGMDVFVLATQAEPDCKDAKKRRAFCRKTTESKKGNLIKLFSLYGSSPGSTVSCEEMADRVYAGVDIKDL